MALPQPEEHWSESAAPASAATTDWESLRNDLESLLRQVENHHLQGSGQPQTDQRHRAALQSVQRAVQRFSEPPAAAAPRSDLESAIDEIRARTGTQRPRRQQPPPPPLRSLPDMPEAFAEDLRAEQPYVPRMPPHNVAPPQPAPTHSVASQPAPTHDIAPQPAPPRPAPPRPRESQGEAVAGLQRLTSAVSGIAGRLERLETDMRATRDASADIAEIASQVGQLTNVVELVAGAVGEQGHVKRLEKQIADLAQLYTNGPRPEIAALTRRIDELGATVDRLAELQVQEIGRAARDAESAGSTQDNAMRAIEDGVRSIYDRIDALEGSYALAPEDLDRLTREMAGVTQALRHSEDSSVLAGIIERLETLSGQIGSMGRVGDSGVSALRDDIEALRDVVGETVAPRFAALESRLESLTSQVGGEAAAAPDYSKLEEQIRALAQRMDQTGQQLSGLTELYKSESGRDASPDYEALAAMVAERTSQEVARLSGGDTGLDETSLGALEERLAKLFSASGSGETSGLLSNVADNLTRVGERLDRLETALETMARTEAAPARPMAQPAPPPAQPPQKPAASMQPAPAPTPQAAVAPSASAPPQAAQPAPTAPEASLSEPPSQPRAPRKPQLSDDMPHAPALDRPLVDDELSTLASPVEDWSSIGFDEPAPHPKEPQAAPPGLPGFDASKIEKPARPKSSFADDAPGFTPMDEMAIAASPEAEEDEPAPVSDRSTFIAAARRAARGNLESKQDADASQSLIGKALARFQSARSAGSEPDKAPKGKKKPEPEEKAPELDLLPDGKATLDDFSVDMSDHMPEDLGKPEGFFKRNRRSLMLAGALVATILLATNLVIQRLAPTAPPASAGAEATGTDMPVDPAPTGSIEPMIKMNLAEPSPTRQVLPSTLTAEPLPGSSALDPTFTHSVPPAGPDPIEATPAPIKLDLPPEELGPLELRQAAADGDPRAQFEIGAIYTEGSVVDQDFKAAMVWYERAAAKGFAPAQYRLGNLYEHGNGVAKDLEQARLWYNRAAEAGNRLAMHNLASLYASGELGEQQFASAAEWFERASEAGMTDSQFNLGMLYARGLGIAQDLKASYKWFSLAAEGGDKDAALARDDIGKSLDDAELAAARSEIAAWHMAPINIPANFAPIGTWSENFDPGQTITDKQVTEGVQMALARLGYDPGSVDGVMGPKTTQAITEFERATGMRPTGLVNPRLLAVLGSQPV